MKDILQKSFEEKLLISFKLHKRKEIIRGFVLDFNDKWILLKHNFTNFIIDGCKLIKIKSIKKYKIDEEEIFFSNVIKLKNILFSFEKIDLTNTENILKYLTKFDAIQYEFYDETKCYIGKIIEINDKKIKFRPLDPNGEWEEIESINLKKIITFEFDTDYINSLLLFNKTKSTK